jgi:hypothetical protein
MSVKKGFFSVPIFLPVAVGILLLGAVLLLGDHGEVEVEAAKFYEVEGISAEKTSGPYLGSVTNETAVTVNDIINITAVNESIPTASTDKLSVDLNVTDGNDDIAFNTTLELAYSGSGRDFYADISLNSTTSDFRTIPGGIMLKVDEGYTIRIKKHNRDITYLKITVDNAAPVIEPVEDPSGIFRKGGTAYATTSASLDIGFEDTDPLSTKSWAVANQKINYTWDSGTEVNWDGLPISIPSSTGTHEIEISATDRFGKSENNTFTYQVTQTLSGTISTPTTYENKTVLSQSLRVVSGGSLDLMNSTFIIMGSGDELLVDDGGYLNISGPEDVNAGNRSILTCSSDGMSVKALPGSNFQMENTEVIDANISVTVATVELWEGTIENSHIRGPNNAVWIRSHDITVKNCILTGVDSGNGIHIDVNHSWSDDAIEISNISFQGTFDVPIRVANNSIWKPYDVATVYYLENSNLSFEFTMVDSSYVNPYLYLPHFFDSRSPEAVLNAQYNNSGVWTDLPSFPLRDSSENWTNGEDARIDLSPVPNGADVRFSFNASDVDNGVLYFGDAHIGSDSRPSLDLDTRSPEFNNIWKRTSVSTSSLLIDDIHMTDANERYIEIVSSGFTTITNLNITVQNITPEADWAVVLEKGTVQLEDCLIDGHQGLSGFIYSDFQGTNDWPIMEMDNVTMKADQDEIGTGIMARGMRYSISETTIENVTTGIDSSHCVINIDDLTIDASEFGADLHLPRPYYEAIGISIENLDITGELKYSGLRIRGNTDNRTTISVSNLNIRSQYNGSHERGDGYGSMMLDVTSTKRTDISMQNPRIDSGPGHGISVISWPDNGAITMAEGTISGMKIDGIWMDDSAKIDILSGDISTCDGWGLFSYPDSEIKIEGDPILGRSEIRANDMGGLKIMEGCELEITEANIDNNDGPAIEMGMEVKGFFEKVDADNNEMGIIGSVGCNLTFTKVTVENSLTGPGVQLTDCDLILKPSEPKSQFLDNAKGGLWMVGGNLTMEDALFKDNSDHGIYLEGVKLLQFAGVQSSSNLGSGLYVNINDQDLLSPMNEYSTILDSSFSQNTGRGIAVVADDSISGTVEIDLKGIKSFGNNAGDLMAPSDIHFTWICIGKDKLGDPEYTGITVASFDIVVEEKGIEIFNEDIKFLNDDASITIGSKHTLLMENAYIRPEDPTSRWRLMATNSNSIDINGGYLGYMDSMVIENVITFNMDGTLVRYGENGIRVKNTDSIDIESCQFMEIDGTALMLQESSGNIIDSGFENNGRGLMIDGLSDNLRINRTDFIENDWGLYVFRGNDTKIYVNNSFFQRNAVAPIWLSRNNMTLTNTDIDPEKIIVKETVHRVDIFYTLKVIVVDEEGNDQVFNVELKFGDSPSAIKVNDISGQWQGTYKIYEVHSRGVSVDREKISLTISYVESTGNNRKYSYIHDQFTLNTMTTKTYVGYKAPYTTVPPQILQAKEDIGFEDGPVDVSDWFTDIGTDEGNLTYSVDPVSPTIYPSLKGSLLSVDLEEDWNGEGYIEVTATDPHGKFVTINVTIYVVGTNDLPFITDPRIVTMTGEDNIPRSGSTIMATWTWHDIDENDSEPSNKYIRWYLNGTPVHRYGPNIIDNVSKINNVREGQIWSFKVWPMDITSIFFKEYGEPVMSPEVEVLGRAPIWKSGLTVNTNRPTTDLDIVVKPGTYEDIDSTVITFNYQWEFLNANDKWVPIGAPNSPILDSRFTEKDMDIRVTAWISDGTYKSDIRTASFQVINSAPVMVNAEITPKVLDEYDDLVRVVNIESFDADGDPVYYIFNWTVGNTSVGVNREVPQLPWSSGGWSYPGKASISVKITPIDSENLEGQSITLNAILEPTDTDGDGLFDDIDGDGENDQGDDKDDDNDGYLDIWEKELGTDPLNRLSVPRDTDGDGIPDGTPGNPFSWMDTDDDDDGILDSEDSHPLNGALPGDLDRDGIGNDVDNDIDGDGVENEDDWDPYNPQVTSAPEKDGQSLIEVLIFILVLIIILVIAGVGYSIYTGRIKLPSTAPPTVGDEGAEAIYEEDISRPSKGEELEEMEELENMSVCSVCGELVSAELDTCPNCGAEFEDAEEDLEMEED